MKLVAVVIATLVAVASSNQGIEEFSNGNLKFTADLYSEIAKVNPSKNFIFSPLSVEVILALTRAGAKGRTQQQLTDGLHLPDPAKTEEALSEFLPALQKNSDELKLLSANRLFLGKKFDILDSFKKISTSLYKAGIENVEFSKPQEAANTINQWVEDQTNKKIKDLLSANALDASTRLVLVNALYFSGKWENAFETGLTHVDKFHTSSTTFKKIDMMHAEDTFKYYESTKRNAKFLELPYLGANITMTIALPNEVEGLQFLESNLEEVLAEPKNYEWQRVAVTMPKWTVESKIELKPILKKLGVTDLFEGTADLSGISNERLQVDDVIQKAFINVTESGTEAAAATAVFRDGSAIYDSEPMIFLADHPFIYVIKYENVILFAGALLN